MRTFLVSLFVVWCSAALPVWFFFMDPVLTGFSFGVLLAVLIIVVWHR